MKIGLYLIISLPLCSFSSPTVSNIRASQRENSKLVDILYDVAYSGSSNVSITCEVSTNSGVSYNVPAQSFSGDFGVMVPTGSDRLVVWNAGVDWDENYSEQVKVRITAKSPRFTDHGDGTVTDNNTGLIWQKGPVSFNDPYYGEGFQMAWSSASAACTTLGEGWRLPTVAEVMEFLDNSRIPRLPAGHPFESPVGEIYWTADFFYMETGIAHMMTECFSLTTTEIIFTAPATVGISSMNPTFHFVWPVRSVY